MAGATFCFDCGRKFMFVKGNMVFVERYYGDGKVRLHKCCVPRFDAEKPLTAQTSQKIGRADNG